MIDIQNAKKVFQEYVKGYDITNSKISCKIDHTGRVADIAKQIAEKLNLTKEEIDLAELIGILHDIGRFEQVRIYNTFNDHKSIDHGDMGVKVLFEEGKIREFISEDKYDEIIKKAIHNHNKYQIEDGLSKQELLQAKIIRDADKTDILYIYSQDYFEETLKDVKTEEQFISDHVIENLKNHKQVDNTKNVTILDRHMGGVGFLFDYNFKEALEIVKEKDYINKNMDKLLEFDFKPETKEQIEIVRKIGNDYLEKQ